MRTQRLSGVFSEFKPFVRSATTQTPSRCSLPPLGALTFRSIGSGKRPSGSIETRRGPFGPQAERTATINSPARTESLTTGRCGLARAVRGAFQPSRPIPGSEAPRRRDRVARGSRATRAESRDAAHPTRPRLHGEGSRRGRLPRALAGPPPVSEELVRAARSRSAIRRKRTDRTGPPTSRRGAASRRRRCARRSSELSDAAIATQRDRCAECSLATRAMPVQELAARSPRPRNSLSPVRCLGAALYRDTDAAAAGHEHQRARAAACSRSPGPGFHLLLDRRPDRGLPRPARAWPQRSG
jgi:hypothetical protein